MGNDGILRIVGAGPAGLTAAIVAAKAGRRVVVSERSSRVAHRFHGDYQGLENWTASEDVLEEIAALGIEPSFDIAPFREQVCYGPDGREHRFHSASRPFYYLVRRGPDPGTLDHALAQQALAAGAEIRFNETVRHPDQGDVVAWGPRRAYILAVGYLFTTDLADGSFAVLDDRLAPKGYGYLLIHRGRATLATCLFSDFHREAQYLERVLDFFQRRLGFTMREPQRFGGVGYIGVNPPVPDEHLFFAGEAAGVQDALWGFGIRYAIRSGSLAAAFTASGDRREYIRQWEEKIGRPLRASFVNRLVFQAGGALGYRLLLRWIAAGRSPGDRLRRLYAPAWWKSAVFPLAYRAFRGEERPVLAGCVCSWCAARVGEAVEGPA